MHPIFITVGLDQRLMVIPDTQAHFDGHAVITRTYHLYKQTGETFINDVQQRKEHLGVNKNDYPNYMGYLTFDVPGRVFTYTDDGHLSLSKDEIRDLIEKLSDYRDNPPLWTVG